jgi:phosphohistidine phosphatase SixA
MKSTKRAFILAATMLTTGALGLMLAGRIQAQELAGDALIETLQKGGYVLVMRHAHAVVPEPREAGGFGRGRRADDADGEPERELTEEGIALVTGMRYAFRALHIPVGDVLTSPTLRTRQHATYFGHGEVHIMAELGNEGMESNAARAQWLADKAAEPPPPGTNTVIVTHGPNIRGAFGIDRIGEGETLIVQPGADGGIVVGRVPIEEWSRLAVD